MPIQYEPYLNLEKIIEFASITLPNGVSRTCGNCEGDPECNQDQCTKVVQYSLDCAATPTVIQNLSLYRYCAAGRIGKKPYCTGSGPLDTVCGPDTAVRSSVCACVTVRESLCAFEACCLRLPLYSVCPVLACYETPRSCEATRQIRRMRLCMRLCFCGSRAIANLPCHSA